MTVETIAEFARRHGVSKQTVHNWRRRGYIVHAKDGHIDREASDRLLDARPAVYRGGVLGGNPPRNGNGNGDAHEEPGTLADALRRKESANARLRELEWDIESGKVVLVSDAIRALGGVLGLVRSGLLRLGQTISTRAATCADAAALKAMVDAEVDQLMAVLFSYSGPVDRGPVSKQAERLNKAKFLLRR